MPAKVTKGSSEKATKASGKAAARKGVSALSKAAASSASSSSSSASSSSSSSDASSDEDDVEEGLPAAPSKSHKAKGKQRESSNDDEDGSGSDGSKEEEDSEDEGPTIDLDKIRKRMHHALRHLSSASKRARQFEVQRLVKRIKAAPPAEKSSLEAQLLIFKSIDLQRIAATCLLGKLGKAKLLPRGATSKDFKTAEAQSEQKGVDAFPLLAGVWSEEGLRQVWTDASPPTDLASDAEKVKAKLLSSKSLAEESSQMVETLGRLAGRVKTEAAAETSAVDDKKEEQAARRGEIAARASKGEDERIWSGSEGEDEDDELGVSSEAESNQEDLDEEAIQAHVAALGDLDQWDALVGAGSSDEEDEESDSDADVAGQEEQAPISKRKRSLSPRDSKPVKKAAKKSDAKTPSKPTAASSDEDEVGVASSDERESDSDASDYSSEGSSASSSSSRHLPSLSHGFLAQSRRRRADSEFSGSEGSDDNDYEGEIEENPEDKASKAKGVKSAKERKNRMGQRARKALWEKKFGRNANHIKILEKESSKTRSADKVSDSKGKPAYKPLRRGRDGKVIPEFEAPQQTDAGWKKFPVATPASEPATAAAAAPAPAPARASASSGGRGGKPAARGGDRHAPSSAPRGGYSGGGGGGGAPPLRFQTQEKQQQEQEMHPSWLAKQKQKEREDLIARSLAGGAGAGKKVTFD